MDMPVANKPGGVYFPGKPLPYQMRQQIINMYEAGQSRAQISAHVGVTHTGVTKIINHFVEYGTLKGLNQHKTRSSCDHFDFNL